MGGGYEVRGEEVADWRGKLRADQSLRRRAACVREREAAG
jgi:hypothetical protein